MRNRNTAPERPKEAIIIMSWDEGHMHAWRSLATISYHAFRYKQYARERGVRLLLAGAKLSGSMADYS